MSEAGDRENCCRYELHAERSESVDDVAQLDYNQWLAVLSARIIAYVKQLTTDYIWQDEPFNLTIGTSKGM